MHYPQVPLRLTYCKIVVATTHHLLIYALPTLGPPFSASPGPETRSRTKQRKEKPFGLEDLELLSTVDRPTLPGFVATETTYRAARSTEFFLFWKSAI